MKIEAMNLQAVVTLAADLLRKPSSAREGIKVEEGSRGDSLHVFQGSGGSVIVRASWSEMRGVVLKVDFAYASLTMRRIFEDVVDDQAFKGDNASAEIADAIYVAVRYLDLLGRHS